MGERIFSGVRAKWQPLYDKFKSMAHEALGDFEIKETSSAILWRHSSTFAEVSAKSSGLVIAFASDEMHDEWEAAKILQTSKNRVVHYFEVDDNTRFPWFVERIAAAYALTKPAKPRAQRAELPSYTTIDEYIALFPDDVQAILERIRRTIRENAPAAVERISWQMPTFWQRENLIHFAAQKSHIGIYPGASGVENFTDRLAGYKTSKGAIQFPLSQPIPYDLIAEITRFRVTEVE